MFTHADLSELIAGTPETAVSIFLPIDVHQGPVILKNLIAEARPLVPPAVLEPASALAADRRLWQLRGHGLAVFLADGVARHFTTPMPLAASVTVGRGFRIGPLLPMLAADGEFSVLTVARGRVRLFDASRFVIAPASEAVGLSDKLDDDADEDDTMHRPHAASADVSTMHVYGESPADRGKTRLVESIRRLAVEVDHHLATRRAPVVLVANPEISGHFRKFTKLGAQLVGVVDSDPEALTEEELHQRAYALVGPHFDEDRRAATERLAMLLGSGDPRGTAETTEIAEAAGQGRIETLLLTGDDTLDTAAAQTLVHDGELHLVPGGGPGAILRY